jgi:hypothetical protein
MKNIKEIVRETIKAEFNTPHGKINCITTILCFFIVISSSTIDFIKWMVVALRFNEFSSLGLWANLWPIYLLLIPCLFFTGWLWYKEQQLNLEKEKIRLKYKEYEK